MSWLNDFAKKTALTAGNLIQAIPSTYNSTALSKGGKTLGVDIGAALQNWGATPVKASDGGDVLGTQNISSPGGATQISSPDANGYAKFSDGSTRYVGGGTQTKTQIDTTGGGNGGSTTPVNTTQTNGFDALISRAMDIYNRAKSYVDPQLEMLKGKRSQFQDLFKQGEGSIAEGYSKSAGEAGATGEAQRTAAANSARALGTGGSYVQGTQNRINDALARTLASVGQVRTQNEQGNRETLNNRNDWATGQEASLNNYLGTAADQVKQAGSGVLEAIANLNAPSAVDSSYGSDVAPTSWDAIINSLNGLDTGIKTSGTGTGNDMGVNIDPNSPYYQFLKKQRVVA